MTDGEVRYSNILHKTLATQKYVIWYLFKIVLINAYAINAFTIKFYMPSGKTLNKVSN